MSGTAQGVTPQEITPEAVENWLVEQIAQRTLLPPATVSVHLCFDEFDIDSADSLVITTALAQWLGFEVDPRALVRYPTIRSLAGYLAGLRRQVTTGGIPVHG
ncbi:acyl carrier protein [Streptomyces cinnabarinus]|uniref:Acyl carrier protein n=1 Tax=Streptomyces cinnabarinus TaxID=67287 RepID=A0ABY7KP38_9ACTN|nr:acyl carrier protein [Streptomyces cinnabarinus]WAZ24664.1 acyl carrier protein [Streptomyces cinnabarinus]